MTVSIRPLDPRDIAAVVALSLRAWGPVFPAMVETGTDPGHAPARALYEKAGYRLVTVARYWKKL